MKIHYSGGIEFANGSRLPGWACCCSGDRCIDIRARGNQTPVRSKVTCAACLKMIEKHDAYAPTLAKLRGII